MVPVGFSLYLFSLIFVLFFLCSVSGEAPAELGERWRSSDGRDGRERLAVGARRLAEHLGLERPVAGRAQLLEDLALLGEVLFRGERARLVARVDDRAEVGPRASAEGLGAAVDGAAVPEDEAALGACDALGGAALGEELLLLLGELVPVAGVANLESPRELGVVPVAALVDREGRVALADVEAGHPALDALEAVAREALVSVKPSFAVPAPFCDLGRHSEAHPVEGDQHVFWFGVPQSREHADNAGILADVPRDLRVAAGVVLPQHPVAGEEVEESDPALGGVAPHRSLPATGEVLEKVPHARDDRDALVVR